jgi:hypothetical protein
MYLEIAFAAGRRDGQASRQTARCAPRCERAASPDDLPERMIFPGLRAPDRKALLRREPLSSRFTGRRRFGGGGRLRQLARVGKDDLGLPLVVADLTRYADVLAGERGLWRPKFLSVFPIDDGSEDGIWE